ncbi:small subunit ribosomal protein S27e [Nematocida sp. AWRm77]|nr:small subunit ribosomal protein S27e [Nematocida sp. AWRm77]
MESLKYPSLETIQRTCKKKRLIPTPNSYFLDVKCGVCTSMTTMFSHSQVVIVCKSCSSVLAKPTGGKAKLTDGSMFRVKPNY